jgi:hypothetical protein
MMALKAAGRITKLPCGRKPRETPRRSKNKVVAHARRLIEEIVLVKKSRPLPSPGPVPTPTAGDPLPAQPLTKADKLSRATELALDIVQQILELGVDPSDVKLLAQVKDTALTIISQQIRVDEGRLRGARSPDTSSYEDMLKAFEASDPKPIEEIFREVEAATEERGK